MTLPDMTLDIWRAALTPLHILAIGCTIVRIYHRCRKRQLWWDDYLAGASMLADVMFAAGPWLRDNPEDTRPSREKRIFVYWYTALLFPLVVWFARISIGMSIARLVPSHTWARYLLYGMNVTFALMCSGQILQKIVTCTRDTSWHYNGNVHCYLGSSPGILSLCTDVAADTCLVAIPVRMLWRVRLPRVQRRLILSIFASSILSSLAGIVHVTFIFELQKAHNGGNWGSRIGFVTGVKAAVTLLVCNLLVIITYLYRVFWKDGDEDLSEPSETRSKPTHALPVTTVPTFTQISTMRDSTEASHDHLPDSLEAIKPSPPMKHRHTV